jgi:hypothetical protein
MISRVPFGAAVVCAIALSVMPVAAQLSDDARFRLQQEGARLDAARENTRIERERALLANPPGTGSVRSDPAANYDRLREEHRLRDETNRLERESDRVRSEQQRLERERLFAPPAN